MKTKMHCVPFNGCILFGHAPAIFRISLFHKNSLQHSDCTLTFNLRFFSLVLFSFPFSIMSATLQTLHCYHCNLPLICMFTFKSFVQWQ